MLGNVNTVILQIKTENVKDDLEEVLSSVGGFQILRKSLQLQNPGFYDLLIMEIGDDPKKELQLANTLMLRGVTKDVFLISPVTNSEILLEALKVGVKGFFPQPINKLDVRDALLKIKEQKKNIKVAQETIKKGKIIYIIGSKGGVGTTTVAVNLAVSLTELEGSPSVALIDMNRLLGDASLFLSIESDQNWIKVAKNISRLDETFLMSVLSKHDSGIYVLPSPVELIDDQTDYHDALETLLRLMQTVFDFIVIDGGISHDNTSKMVMKMSDKILLVFILSIPSIITAKRILDIFRKGGYPREENIEIIENRFLKNSDISLKDVEKSLNKKVLCSIPNDYKISMSAINEGKPLYLTSQGTEIQKKYKELAHAFNGRHETRKEK